MYVVEGAHRGDYSFPIHTKVRSTEHVFINFEAEDEPAIGFVRLFRRLEE